jgi:hypothetical protein
VATFNWQDLTKVADDAGFSVVPANTYDAEVVTATADKTGGGKDKFKVRFKITTGPHANQSLFNDFVISPEVPNAMGFFFRHMAALGLSREYFNANPTLSTVAAALVGRQCRLKVIIDVWNEQERNKVVGVLPPEGGPVAAPMPSASGAVPMPGVPGVTPSLAVPAMPLPMPSPVVTATNAAPPALPF